jgi:hypothetical protein
MTETAATSPAGTGAVPRQRPAEPETTGWVGWIFFAGLMAVLVGSFQVIAGLVALFEDGYYLVVRNGLVLHLTYNEWGWIHLALGVVLVAVGFGIMAGQMWARVLGIAIASLSAIANFLFLAAYPVWGIVMITVDVLIIYALAAHGREVKSY